MGTILIIILILLLIGALPSWPYSSGWGYYPSGGLGLILVIILVLALLGRLNQSVNYGTARRQYVAQFRCFLSDSQICWFLLYFLLYL